MSENELEVAWNVSDDSEVENVVDEEPESDTDKRSHKRVKKTGTEGLWQHDVLKSPVVVECAMRNKISPTALASITRALICATGGDPSRANLHFSTAYRYKMEAAVSITENIKKSWSPPSPALLQWDGKLMESLDNKYVEEERMTVLVSGK